MSTVQIFSTSKRPLTVNFLRVHIVKGKFGILICFSSSNFRLLRNRVSAQQARERKKAYLNELEVKVKELESRNSELEERLSTLQNDNQMLRRVCICHPHHHRHMITSPSPSPSYSMIITLSRMLFELAHLDHNVFKL